MSKEQEKGFKVEYGTKNVRVQGHLKEIKWSKDKVILTSDKGDDITIYDNKVATNVLITFTKEVRVYPADKGLSRKLKKYKPVNLKKWEKLARWSNDNKK